MECVASRMRGSGECGLVTAHPLSTTRRLRELRAAAVVDMYTIVERRWKWPREESQDRARVRQLWNLWRTPYTLCIYIYIFTCLYMHVYYEPTLFLYSRLALHRRLEIARKLITHMHTLIATIQTYGARWKCIHSAQVVIHFQMAL